MEPNILHPKKYMGLTCTPKKCFSRLNALGVYLKFGSFDPAFFRGRRLSGVRRLLMKCDF